MKPQFVQELKAARRMQTPGASVLGQTQLSSLQPRPGSSQAGASTGRNKLKERGKKKRATLITRTGGLKGWSISLPPQQGHCPHGTAQSREQGVPVPAAFLHFKAFNALHYLGARQSLGFFRKMECHLFSLGVSDLRERNHLGQKSMLQAPGGCICRAHQKSALP